MRHTLKRQRVTEKKQLYRSHTTTTTKGIVKTALCSSVSLSLTTLKSVI